MNKKLKIAIISKPHTKVQIPSLGGMTNFVYFLAQGMAEKGHKVTVFAGKNSQLPRGVKINRCLAEENETNIYEAGNDFYKKTEREHNNCRDIINKSFGELARRFDRKTEYYLKAFSIINNQKFDVMHIVSQDIIALYPVIFSTTPAVISLHGHHSCLSDVELRWLHYLQMTRKAKLKINGHFVAVSKFIKKEFSSFLKAELIYNSIDFRNYHLNKNKKNYMVCLGRIEEGKGFDFAVSLSKKCQIPLTIAGNVVDQWYFDNKLKPHIDNKLIKFVGVVDERQKNKLLGEAKCLIMPTRYKEAFGRVVVEALACGTPVIGFNNGAVEELVKNNKTGFLVEQDNLGQAEDALNKIANIDPEVCRRFAEKYFTLTRMIEQYEKLYQRIKL